ncbi:MAG: ABC transporter permease [Nitrospiraceae bacterium]
MAIVGFDRQDIKLAWVFWCMHLKDKYLGSRLGGLWAVANPLLLLMVFVFVFGRIFKATVIGSESTLSYTIWLVGGYGPWLATSEAITAASVSVIGNAGLVKNMPLKTEILPFTASLIGLIPLTVSLVVLAVLLIADGNTISWHAVFALAVVVLQFGLIVGVGFIASALTVFVRDFQFVLPNILMMILFATPIVYPWESMPDIMKTISLWNPFYIITEGYRQALIRHQAPDLVGFGYVAIVTLVAGIIGLSFFRRCKGYFGARL